MDTLKILKKWYSPKMTASLSNNLNPVGFKSKYSEEGEKRRKEDAMQQKIKAGEPDGKSAQVFAVLPNPTAAHPPRPLKNLSQPLCFSKDTFSIWVHFLKCPCFPRLLSEQLLKVPSVFSTASLSPYPWAPRVTKASSVPASCQPTTEEEQLTGRLRWWGHCWSRQHPLTYLTNASRFPRSCSNILQNTCQKLPAHVRKGRVVTNFTVFCFGVHFAFFGGGGSINLSELTGFLPSIYSLRTCQLNTELRNLKKKQQKFTAKY